MLGVFKMERSLGGIRLHPNCGSLEKQHSTGFGGKLTTMAFNAILYLLRKDEGATCR